LSKADVTGAKRVLAGSRAGAGKALTFRRKVLWLAAGVGGSHVIALLATPLLTRLYTPTAFGYYAIFMAIVSIASVLVTLRYERGIVISRSASERNGLVGVIAMLGAVALLLGFGLGAWYYGGRQFPARVLAAVAWAALLAIALTFEGLGLAGRMLVLKGQGYRWITSVRFGGSALQASLQLGLGFLFGGWVLGLPIGLTAGVVVIALSYFGRAMHAGLIDFRRYRPTLRRIVAAARRNVEFPKLMTVSGLANSATPQMMVLIVGTLLSAAASGQIFLAQRIIKLPMTLMSGTISDANFQEASELPRRSIRRLYRRRAGRLALAVVVPLGLLALFGPALFELVFGAEWRVAGTVTRILAPGLFLQFVFTPFCSLFTVLRRQDIYLWWSLGRLALVSGLVWAGAARFGLYGAAAGYSLAIAAAFIVVHFLLEALLAPSGNGDFPAPETARAV
jgi:O-antigen/teichoic acid export membrane protein